MTPQVGAHLHRPPDGRGIEEGFSVAGGPPVGFPQEVGQQGEAGAQPGPVLGYADAALQHGRRAVRGQGTQLVFGDDLAEESGVFGFALGGALHGGVEFGADLEKLLEVGIRLVEEVVAELSADHDDLEGYFDRFRLEKSRLGEQAGRVVDFHDAGLQDALEVGPGVLVGEDILRAQDEHAA